MLDLVRQSIASQYGAALKMLEAAIDQCESKNWLAKVGQHPFWHVAYHVLFCTDMYLSPSEAAFRPQPFHRKNYNFLEKLPFPPFSKVIADLPYDKETLLSYVNTCRTKVIQALNNETESILSGPSGFAWIPFPRAQLHLYNLRHIQHHTGALSAFLARTQDKSATWIGADPIL